MNLRNAFALLSIILLSSCLGPKKIDGWIDKHYDGSVPPPVKSKTDLISFNSAVTDMGDKLSVTEKQTSNMLPLLFYWQWDYKNTSTLNPRIPMNTFTSTVNGYINRGLKQKLNGQKLELTVEKMPTAFTINDKEHYIWLVHVIHWNKITINPDKTELTVSYKVLNADNSVAKNGRVTITNNDENIKLGMFKSLKKTTWQYLDDYNANLAAMTKRFAEKLMAEI
jgi:hypothetical protein